MSGAQYKRLYIYLAYTSPYPSPPPRNSIAQCYENYHDHDMTILRHK